MFRHQPLTKRQVIGTTSNPKEMSAQLTARLGLMVVDLS